MTETKIRRSIYILIGLTVLIIIGMVLGWFFVLMRPQNDEIAAVKTKFNDRSKKAGELKKALDDQQMAEDKKRYVDAQLAFFRGSAETKWRGRYRAFRFDDIGADPATLTPEQKAKRNDAFGRALRENFSSYGFSLKQALIDQADAVPMDMGRKLIFNTAVKVDPPPKMPEDLTVPANGLIKPTGATGGGALTATITGSFAQIKDYFNRINRAPILFVIGNIKLATAGAATTTAGTTDTTVPVIAPDSGPPPITCTFTITPYLLATGEGAQKLNIASTGGGGGAPEGTPEGGPPAEGAPAPTN